MNLGRTSFLHRLTALMLLMAVFFAQSFAFSPYAFAATGVPSIISYQGRLRDASGNLLGASTGTPYYFKFSIYDNASVGSGTKLWPSGAPSLTTSTVTSGIFTVKIGDTANGYPDTLDYNFQDNRDVYLQIEVSSDGSTFETLSPRQRIASAGFAINAGTVQGFTPSQTPSGNAIPVLNSGNLLLSGTNPQINATSTNALILQGGGGTGDIRFFNASNTLSSVGNLLLAGGITATGGSSSFATTTAISLTVSGTTSLQGVTLTNASTTNVTASGFINAGSLAVSGASAIGSLTFSNATGTGNFNIATLTTTATSTLAALSVSGQTSLGNTSSTNLTVSGSVYLPTASIGPSELASTAVSAGTYGSGTEIAVFTVDADGRLTSATSTAVALGASAITSGILGVARGGTNTSTLGSAGSLAYSDGTGYAFSAVGSANQLLTSGGTGAPTFQNIASLLTAGSNISISGTTNATIALSSTPSVTTLTVTGTSTLANVSSTALTASGAVNLGSTLAVTGATTLATTTVTGITASTNGLTLSSSTPLSTTNTLYNLGGSLYFNGSAVGGSGATASGTTGYIQLSNGSGGFTANSLFKWDNTNARLGIGTSATPSSTLHVVGDFTVTATSTFQGPTIIDDLQLGAAFFDANAGQLSWIDMPVTSAATAGTVQAYSAQIDGNPLLTIYAQSDGSGGIQNSSVQVGTSTAATGLFTVATSSTIFNVTSAGLVGIGTGLTPSSTLHVVGTFQATGLSTLAAASTTALTASGAVNLGSTLAVTGATTLATTTVTGITASTNGLTLSSSTPLSTTNTLYNLGGSLYFNGSAVGGGSGPFTDGSGISYLTDTAEDFALGGSTVTGSPFGVDVSAGEIYGGLASTAGLKITSRATTGAGSVGFELDTVNDMMSAGTGRTALSVKTGNVQTWLLGNAGGSGNYFHGGVDMNIRNTHYGTNLRWGVVSSDGSTDAGAYVQFKDNGDANWPISLHSYIGNDQYTRVQYLRVLGSSVFKRNMGIETASTLFLDGAQAASGQNTEGDTYFTKSTASGGNLSTYYDGTEVQRFSATTTGAIGTSLTVGSLANPSSTLHVVGTFQVTGTSTLAAATATGITISTNGLTLSSSTPAATSNTLYNLGGSLYFNGSTVGGASASGTAGLVQFSNGSGGLNSNSLFNWDNTNARLALGTSASASSTLHVVGDFQVSATSTLNGQTTIYDLTTGPSMFETDAGQVSWIDMPVTASSSNGTVVGYSAQLDGNQMIVVYGTADGSGGVSNLGVGFGTSTPAATVHAYASGATVGVFDRGASDGTVISIRRDNAEQGTISVTSGTVSYNAFTGSHYALLNEPSSTVDFGDVVTLTGNNSRLHNNETDEILYGISRASTENDPAVLGVYLGPQESSKPASVDNPILVMAVGNGEVWVVADQDETSVLAGDYLITSDIPGYAMRDPRTATTSYIFARAGETINWSEVTATAGEGRKKAKISVFFESFARDNAAVAPNVITRTVSGSGSTIGTLETMQSLVVDGPLTVKGLVTLGKDSAGQVKILAGDQRVRVAFATAYNTMPIINVTPVGESALDANFRYAIISQSSEEFVIALANPALREIRFNWTAFASAENALLTVSQGQPILLSTIILSPAVADPEQITLSTPDSEPEDSSVEFPASTSTASSTPEEVEDLVSDSLVGEESINPVEDESTTSSVPTDVIVVDTATTAEEVITVSDDEGTNEEDAPTSTESGPVVSSETTETLSE